jgi:hypothetical protein
MFSSITSSLIHYSACYFDISLCRSILTYISIYLCSIIRVVNDRLPQLQLWSTCVDMRRFFPFIGGRLPSLMTPILPAWKGSAFFTSSVLFLSESKDLHAINVDAVRHALCSEHSLRNHLIIAWTELIGWDAVTACPLLPLLQAK